MRLFPITLLIAFATSSIGLCFGVVDQDANSAPVIIVGAGMAGAKVAYELAKKNVSFIIVEATSQVGGRLRKSQLGPGGPKIELGGNWLQGYRRNDTFSNLVKDTIKLDLVLDDLDDYYIAQDGKLIPDKLIDPVWHKLERALNRVYAFRRRIDNKTKRPSSNDMSVKAALLLLGGWVATTPEEFAAQQAYIDYEYSTTASQISVYELSSYYDPFEEATTQYFVTDKRGYGYVVKWHLEQIGINPEQSSSKLLLSSPVDLIGYDSTGGYVVLRNGTRIEGSAVVCTASLGVLKAAVESNPGDTEKLQFNPALPYPKRLAISKYGFGNYLKVFVSFRSALFTDQDPLYIAPVSCREDYFVSIQNFNKKDYLPGENVVLVTAVGAFGRQLQCESRNEVLNLILEAVSEALGRTVLPWEVRSLVVSPIGENPYFRGMYSFRPVGITKGNLYNLIRPVGALFFAGEAFAFPETGYVQSAWMSAIKTTKDVMKFLKLH